MFSVAHTAACLTAQLCHNGIHVSNMSNFSENKD